MPAYSRAPQPSPLDDLDLSREAVEALLSAATDDSERETVLQYVEELLPFTSPANFAQRVDPDFLIPPHIAFLDKTITDLVSGRLGKRKLIVTMPPRHGKSELCSKYLPAWFLSRYPDRRIILTSYEADFAQEWGRKARDVLSEAADWC